jgi:tetratricopeptide (TPR) repeat protein
MRKLLAAVSGRLREFVAQREDFALILGATEADALPLLSILEGIEGEQESDFFWTFTDAFTDAGSYADAIVNAFAAKHGAVRLAMEKEAMAPWPALPPVIESPATPPAMRLRQLAGFSRELLPVPTGGVVVWTFFPLGIENPPAYAELMRELIAHQFPFPWCHHLRFILRDDPASPLLVQSCGKTARVQSYAPDLSVDALNRSIDAEAQDDDVQLAERMSSLLISAGNDLAFQRFPAALEKYALLLQYHGSMNNYPLAAVALHGMGQVYERMGQLDEAEQAYQAALVPASQGEYPPLQVFLNVILSLAGMRMSQQRWEEAEGYWDSSQQLATVMRDAPLRVRSLERRGVCQQQRGLLQEAEASWKAGAVIAAQLRDADLCGSVLERLHALYAVQNKSEWERTLRGYLADLGRPVTG